ncbi:MAG: T9SS type A sorting domain-containing protein [Bacteroidia bacterium]
MKQTRLQRLSALALCFLSSLMIIKAQVPPNDDLCNARLLVVGNPCVATTNGENTNATLQTGEPLGSCFATPNNTVWYKFEAPSSGFVIISTDFPIGSNNDTEIALYGLPFGNCSTPANLQQIACDQDNGTVVSFNSIISSAPVIPGDTFFIQGSGWQGLTGSFCIEVNALPVPPAAQSNDTLCNAFALTVGANCNSVPIGDNTFATQQVYEPMGSCFGNSLRSVWFSFVAPPSGLVSVSTDIAIGTLTDTEIAVYALPSGDCNNLNDLLELSCDQDGGNTVAFNSFINGLNVNPGTTYYVQVSGFQGVEGSFCIEVTELPTLPNDDVCDAVLVPVDGSILSFSNVGATAQLGENNLGLIGGAGDNNFSWFQVDTSVQVSVWLKFIVPPSGVVNLDLCGTGATTFDTQVAVFETTDCNDFGQFILKNWNDDQTGNCNSGSSIFASNLIASCLTAGDTAWVLVDGFLGEVGTFDIKLTEVQTPPISVVATIIAPDCPGTSTGIIDIRTQGGSPPFRYSWNNGATTEDLRNIPAGNYNVLIFDNCDSTTTYSVSIVDAPALLVNAGDDQSSCGNNSVTIGGNPSANAGNPFESKRAFGINLDGGEMFRHEMSKGDNPQVIGLVTAEIFAADFVAGQLMGLDNDQQLLMVLDTATSVPSMVGASIPMTGHDWTGLAYNQQDQLLYAISTDANTSQLYTIDPLTGTATPTQIINRPVPIWLAIDTAGLAYTLDISDNNLYSLDLQTGFASRIGNVGFDAQFAQDADFDPETNQLYLASYSNNTPTSEFRIANIASGNTALISDLAVNGEVGGWAIAPESRTPYFYTWTPLIGLSNPFSPNPLATPIADTDYVLNVADACGTVTQDTISIRHTTGPITNLKAISDDGSANGGQAIAITTGGMMPYTYSWNNGATTDTLNGISPGIYTVYITDALGCQIKDSVRVGASSIEEQLQAGVINFSLAPNPNDGIFNLDLKLKQATWISWQIYDLQGQSVYQHKAVFGQNFNPQINLGPLPAGLYLFALAKDGQKLYKSLLIR